MFIISTWEAVYSWNSIFQSVMWKDKTWGNFMVWTHTCMCAPHTQTQYIFTYLRLVCVTGERLESGLSALSCGDIDVVQWRSIYFLHFLPSAHWFSGSPDDLWPWVTQYASSGKSSVPNLFHQTSRQQRELTSNTMIKTNSRFNSFLC